MYAARGRLKGSAPLPFKLTSSFAQSVTQEAATSLYPERHFLNLSGRDEMSPTYTQTAKEAMKGLFSPLSGLNSRIKVNKSNTKPTRAILNSRAGKRLLAVNS